MTHAIIRTAVTTATLLGLLAPRIALATDHGHTVSITNSPLHMLVSPGIVEMTGEYALRRDLGIALIGGYGNTTFETQDEVTGDIDRHPVRIYEAGTSARYYLLGSYDHGMQIGAEAMYLRVESADPDEDIEATANALSVGPFIGYKKTARFGLTFDAQLGYEWYAMRAHAEDDDGNRGSAGGDGRGLLLNLNLGWAF